MKRLSLALFLVFALFTHLAAADAGLACGFDKADAANQKLARDVYQIDFYSKKLMEKSAFDENGKTVSADAMRDRYVDAFSESMLLRACGNPALKGAQKRQALDGIPSKPQIKYQLSAQEEPSLMLGPRIGFASLTSRVQATLMYQKGFPEWNAAPEAVLLRSPLPAPEISLLALVALHQTLSGGGSMGQQFLDFWGYRAGAGTALAATCHDPEMNALLDKYMNQNGLYQRGFDKELVLALMMTESGCENDKSNGQGIMQVEACESMGCSLEQNIDMGTQHLAGDYDYAVSMGATGGDIPNLIFFGYNRGKGSEELAMTIYRGGADLKSAMNQACLSNFDASKCEGDGLGMHYPERVAQYYSGAT